MRSIFSPNPRAALVLGLAVTVLTVGCGKQSGAGRLPVYGTVLLADGEKIDGSIIFTPVAGNSAPVATTSLAGGSYRFDADNGPMAGRYEVLVRRAVRKVLPSKPSGSSRESPAKPKTEWKFAREVPAKGPYQLDFKLE